LEKFAPEIERYQSAWNRHLSPLLHAPGHPEEGTYLDSVTLDEAVEAQLRYYEEVSPPGHLDRPYLHVEKRIPYEKIRDRQATWDQSDLQSNRELYDWIIAQPEDPLALPGDYWLPADPSDKDATTRREFLRARLRAREAAIFEEGAR
jgi:hypothetical protein